MTSLALKVKTTIRSDGLRAGMQRLNADVPYRYSAVFTFHGDMLRNVCLVDKQNAEITGCGDQPITDSYCFYIHRSGETFAVEDAPQDKRVEGHPKRESYHCYYGVPLSGDDGKLLGTVCHFDVMPIRVTDDIAVTLDELAPVIATAVFG